MSTQLAPASGKYSLRRILVLCWCAILPVTAAAEEFVVVSSTAAPGYNRALPEGKGLRPETYTFMKGLYLGGNSRDSSVEKMEFMTIAKTLARGLAIQNYFPIKDPTQADLVIMVHWGTTQIYEEPNPQLQIENLNASLSEYNAAAMANGGIADPGAVNRSLSEIRGGIGSQAQSIVTNARLLGYYRSLAQESKRPFGSTDELTMKLELAEERYFVVLMAYDRVALKRGVKSPVLWVTRMSIRSPGNNFTDAMPAMVRIAVDSFGRNRDGLQRVRASARGANIDIGTPEVVDPVVERVDELKK